MFRVFVVVFLTLVAFISGTIFEHEVLDAENNVVKLSKYESAKAILIVNTASNCGYTYTNYKELKDLHEKYHEQGLEILAFPSNQFGDQEPGTNEEIQTFVRNYGISFPVFAKIDVNGGGADPLYKYLKKDSDKLEIGWNFVKFLVVDGRPVKRYHSRISPKKIEADILSYLEGEEWEEGTEEL